eukprot:2891106-Amphidinium_carterae.1
MSQQLIPPEGNPCSATFQHTFNCIVVFVFVSVCVILCPHPSSWKQVPQNPNYKQTYTTTPHAHERALRACVRAGGRACGHADMRGSVRAWVR